MPIRIPAAVGVVSRRAAIRLQAEGAAKRMAALLDTTPTAAGMRMGMANDWGSPTGFSYTLNFVNATDIATDDERIKLASGAILFIERKALWVGEGGLLGATIDMDDEFNLIVTTKDADNRQH
eukprot:CAMPEP_0115884204 /NCGR_PEP_ID=MMETSP0287-20121206/29991_1 /TAXON_ID=412157 /ORGANISM="Chrysochromulina rotalis, Strain UIO044" /LENGTH=122 /DNA_ID=CAMNT_0003340489 /DNA_START=307 /DNA_END=676 /DNA_ORIENTATION=-